MLTRGATGQRHRRFASITLAGLLVALAACGGDDGGDEEAEETSTTEAAETDGASTDGTCDIEDVSWVATTNEDLSEIQVYDEPDGEVIHTLANPKIVDEEDPSNTSPVAFLVDGPEDPREEEWVHVHLPVPPNDSRGYVRLDDVAIRCHGYRITVDLAAHTLTLAEEGEEMYSFDVGLGRSGRETRPGSYYITELLASKDPSGPYGPYAYGISGFPEADDVLSEFGSDATIGIHGTNDPDSIGSAVSSGCIRLQNEDIERLVAILPLGVPVDVV